MICVDNTQPVIIRFENNSFSALADTEFRFISVSAFTDEKLQ